MPRRRHLEPNALTLSEDEQSAWEGLLRVHATLLRELDDQLAGSEGLPLSSYDVLLQLARAPGRRLRMSELAEAVLLSPSGITRLVERLERQGLVERVRAGDDARSAYATLTARGRHRLRKATVTHLAAVRRHFLDELSRDERRLLADIWTRTLGNLSASERPSAETRERS